jgi:hypothetical protein
LHGCVDGGQTRRAALRNRSPTFRTRIRRATFGTSASCPGTTSATTSGTTNAGHGIWRQALLFVETEPTDDGSRSQYDDSERRSVHEAIHPGRLIAQRILRGPPDATAPGAQFVLARVLPADAP